MDAQQLNDKFLQACTNGDLATVKYVLSSPELNSHADIHGKDDLGFQWACTNGHLEVVRYLLFSTDITEHSDIHVQNDYGFRIACGNGYLDLVKYFLTDPEIIQYGSTHANIHAEHDAGFNGACLRGEYKVIEYLIFEQGIDQTEKINNFLAIRRAKYDQLDTKRIKKMFEKRDFKNKLESNLELKSSPGKKIKL